MKDRITTLLFKNVNSGFENRYDLETLELGQEIIEVIYRKEEFINYEQF